MSRTGTNDRSHVVLTAVATDDREGQSTSDAINVTVPPNVGPEVVITSPSAGRGVSVGSTLKVSVTASDSDGDVTELSSCRETRAWPSGAKRRTRLIGA